jgi:hypothetical protein
VALLYYLLALYFPTPPVSNQDSHNTLTDCSLHLTAGRYFPGGHTPGMPGSGSLPPQPEKKQKKNYQQPFFSLDAHGGYAILTCAQESIAQG